MVKLSINDKKPEIKKIKIEAKPLPLNCTEFKISNVYPKYNKNMTDLVKQCNEQMYTKVKDNFPLPQALLDEDSAG